MIPAGTGFTKYRTMRIKRDVLRELEVADDSELEEESVAMS
jgi:ribosomal protein S6